MNIIQQNGNNSFYLEGSQTVFYAVPNSSQWSYLTAAIALSVFTGNLYAQNDYPVLPTGLTGAAILDQGVLSRGPTNTISFGLTTETSPYASPSETGNQMVFHKPFFGITSYAETGNFLNESINSTGQKFAGFINSISPYNITGYCERLAMSLEENYCSSTSGERPFFISGIAYDEGFRVANFSMAPLLHESLSGYYKWNVLKYVNTGSIFQCLYNNPQNFPIQSGVEINGKISSIKNITSFPYKSPVSNRGYLFGTGIYFAISWPYTDRKLRVHDVIFILE